MKKYVVVDSHEDGFGTREFDTLKEAEKHAEKKLAELKDVKCNLFIVYGDTEDDDFMDSEVIKEYKIDFE